MTASAGTAAGRRPRGPAIAVPPGLDGRREVCGVGREVGPAGGRRVGRAEAVGGVAEALPRARLWNHGSAAGFAGDGSIPISEEPVAGPGSADQRPLGRARRPGSRVTTQMPERVDAPPSSDGQHEQQAQRGGGLATAARPAQRRGAAVAWRGRWRGPRMRSWSVVMVSRSPG